MWHMRSNTREARVSKTLQNAAYVACMAYVAQHAGGKSVQNILFYRSKWHMWHMWQNVAYAAYICGICGPTRGRQECSKHCKMRHMWHVWHNTREASGICTICGQMWHMCHTCGICGPTRAKPGADGSPPWGSPGSSKKCPWSPNCPKSNFHEHSLK